MTTIKPKQPQSTEVTHTPSAYVAARQAQAWRRLRRWLPLLPSLPEEADFDASRWGTGGLTRGIRPNDRWVERLARLKAWLLAQPERWRRLLVAWRLSRTFHHMSRREWLALGLAAGLTLNSLSQPLLVLAQEPLGDEFQVDQAPIHSHQFVASVGMDATGAFVIAWISYNQDGSEGSIYARQYNTAGTPQGNEFQVNTTTTNYQSDPSVGMDADGDFVVAWVSYGGQDGSDSGIYAQRYNAQGTPQGNEFQVNATTTDYQSKPSVGMDADGDFVVAWQASGQDGSGSGIYAQRYNAQGTPQGNEFRVNATTTDDQRRPSVGMDADGDFVVAWRSDSQDGSDSGIYAQRYNAQGTPQGTEFQVNTYTRDFQWNPSVGMDADGDFVVAWVSQYQDGDRGGIYAQRYNATGTPQGSEFQVNTDTTQHQWDPSVGMDADGNFVIAWPDEEIFEYPDIDAQRYQADGTPQGDEFQITLANWRQTSPSVALDEDGDFVVAWQKYYLDGPPYYDPYYSIYARLYGQPNITINGQGQEIVTGDANPSPDDGTDFGTAIVGSDAITRTFTIDNSGLAELTVDSVAINGPNAGDFTVTQPPTSPIPANSSTIFTLQFSPSAAGLRTAQVSLSNNDADENPYTFAIQGSGTPAPAPEIMVNGLGQEIVDGDTSPSSEDDTDFGFALVGSSAVTHTFTISNTGTAELVVGQVSLSGVHIDDFRVVQQPTSPIPPGGSSPFQISFSPSFVGPRTVSVSLENHDADENPYTFAIQGTGVEVGQSVEETIYLPLVIKPNSP